MSDEKKDYFAVYRQLIRSDLWLSEKFTRGQAWVDMIGLANYKDGFLRKRGIKIPIKRGQIGWSQLSLAERWKWSRGKVKRFLNELENDQNIVQQTVQQNSRLFSLITVVKYDDYQLGGTTDDTTDGQQTDNRQYSNKKVKKVKKVKNINKKSFKKNKSYTHNPQPAVDNGVESTRELIAQRYGY